MGHDAATLRDHEGLEARVLNGTTTKADVEWLVESLETVTAERDDLREKLAPDPPFARADDDIRQALRCLAQMTVYAPNYALTVRPFADAHQESCRVLARLQKAGVPEAGKGDWRELIPETEYPVETQERGRDA